MTDETTGQPRQNAPEAPFTTPAEAPRPAAEDQQPGPAAAPGTASDSAQQSPEGDPASSERPAPDVDPATTAPSGSSQPGGTAGASDPHSSADHTGGSESGDAGSGNAGPDGEDDDSGEVAVSEPGKVMRIGTMAKQLLEEVRNMELDEAGRARLAEIYRRTIDELSEGMSSELADELKRLNLPFDGESAPTAGELRIAQAQLVGWLEGLFHGIQTAIMAQQALAQQRGGNAQGALPPGMVVVPQGGEGRSSGNPKDDGHSGTGNYL